MDHLLELASLAAQTQPRESPAPVPAAAAAPGVRAVSAACPGLRAAHRRPPGRARAKSGTGADAVSSRPFPRAARHPARPSPAAPPPPSPVRAAALPAVPLFFFMRRCCRRGRRRSGRLVRGRGQAKAGTCSPSRHAGPRAVRGVGMLRSACRPPAAVLGRPGWILTRCVFAVLQLAPNPC
jgi:hypothetical protein